MFEDWRQAWRQAVENFRREMDRDDVYPGEENARLRAMRRDVHAARAALDRLRADVTDAAREAAAERGEADACLRREEMARRIGDEETARIAAEYAARYAERAGVLERKAEVLHAEVGMRARELHEMESALGERYRAATASRLSEVNGAPPDQEFSRLDRQAREREAEARLEELKRRMR